MRMEVRTVAVIGAGTMGAGIAQVCAQSGWHTRIFDAFPKSLENGVAKIYSFWEKGIEKGKTTEEEKKTKELMEGERKSKELEEAKELQTSLLPKVLPVVEGFDISTYLKPATEIGGDYYDFFYKKGEYFYAICGDATGHGVISGIMVSVTKAGLNGCLLYTSPSPRD